MTSKTVAQKQPPSNHNQNDKKPSAKANEDEDQEVLLTPHTRRLLTLIQNGSHEHASMAALQLTTITAQSSPLVLWDVLGRLQTFLVASSWQTRHNASMAMHGVARHVPPRARRQFIEQILRDKNKDTAEQKGGNSNSRDTNKNENATASSNDKKKPQKEYLWLTLQDIQQELNVILQQGRLLWAYAEQDAETETTVVNREEEVLHQLDQQQLAASKINTGVLDGQHNETQQDNDKDFVQRRIQWQRRILAQRVGLSGLLQATGGATALCLADSITSEDFLPSVVTSKEEEPLKQHQQQNDSEQGDDDNQQLPNTNKNSRSRKRPRKGTRTKPKTNCYNEDKTNDQYSSSSRMRALLVLEMKREQRTSNNSGGGTCLTHDNPQMLLATELLYRVFDPSWFVRHGALLGLLSLLRAWHHGSPPSSSSQSAPEDIRNQAFGAWPNDILARCFAVLLLDRFGDYSGTTTTTTTTEDKASSPSMPAAESGCVVAPARETAGQLLAMVWFIAPSDIQHDTLNLLYQLATGSFSDYAAGSSEKEAAGKTKIFESVDDRSTDWEIRHGALLALKYIVAVQVASSSSSSSSPRPPLLLEIAHVAVHCLADTSDDVQSVAAQILATLATLSSLFEERSLRNQVLEKLWMSLGRTRDMSSSILDLMNLCSALLHFQDCAPENAVIPASVEDNGNLMTGPAVLCKFRSYLDHDLLSVKVAALRAIAGVVEPIWKSLVTAGQDAETTLKAMDRIQERIFRSYMQDVAAVSHDQKAWIPKNKFGDVHEEAGDSVMSADFRSCRSRAWSKLGEALHKRSFYRQYQQSFESLVCSLILRFFGFCLPYQEPGGRDLFPGFLSAADALSEILCISKYSKEKSVSKHRGTHLDLLELSLNTCLRSPWKEQCEAACLLMRALCKKLDDFQESPDEVLVAIVISCRESIMTMLKAESGERAPACLAIMHNKSARVTIQDLAVIELRDKAFLSGIELIQRTAGTKVADATASIASLWMNAIQSRTRCEEIFTVTTRDVAAMTDSMQVFAALAGTSLAGSKGTLPTGKATPIIRPIMTSLKNEVDPTRLNQTCEFMVELLCSMFAGDATCSPVTRARDKILKTMCDSIGSHSGVSETNNCSKEVLAFSRVLQMLVNAMPKHCESLECITPIWNVLQPLSNGSVAENRSAKILPPLNILEVVCGDLCPDRALSNGIVTEFMPALVRLASRHQDCNIRGKCCEIVQSLSSRHSKSALPVALPVIVANLEDRTNDSHRLWSCQLLDMIVRTIGLGICPFVRRLLRLVMSLMADPIPSCAKTANGIFARLVQVAPLVPCEQIHARIPGDAFNADSVVDHLIHGRPLPSYSLPPPVQESLIQSGTSLRHYQMEGVAWLRFLQSVNLNGALCDSMGLGKTLQALIGVAISHVDCVGGAKDDNPKSLVVCPSSVVGHWEKEIRKFFPGDSLFRPLALTGSGGERKAMFELHFAMRNIVVTSYSALRSDVDILSKPLWRFCILDEGHLLKNPKTATARASRRIRAHHKLILTGTPVQNKVNEIFATFDFLMPNFLGSSATFSKEYAKPITKGHFPGATAESINEGQEKLKLLHQQVLPFILRREKSQVLKELPPKNISTVPCEMSSLQQTIYQEFLATGEAKRSVEELQRALEVTASLSSETSTNDSKLGADALKAILFLRLLCTHPLLVRQASKAGIGTPCAYDVSMSGKFLVLAELLRACGIHRDEITGADNDTSLLYCNGDDEDDDGDSNDISNLLDPVESDDLAGQPSLANESSSSKCLLFAQFTQSLDVVEQLLVKRHMPSLRYLRLDGRVPASKRTALVDAFNSDPSIKLMLLTTRVGGLGLNLTGADTVIFLENDFNPFADMQAADRAHRIGQAKTVNVYRLVTKDSIEEKIMALQEKKIALSNALVNTDNSTLFSMGTDRLLDIFTGRSNSETPHSGTNEQSGYNLDALVESYKSEYAALSVTDFIDALKK